MKAKVAKKKSAKKSTNIQVLKVNATLDQLLHLVATAPKKKKE